MTDSGMKLRSVHMKSGGAKVHVLHTLLNENGENLQGVLQRHAREIAEFSEPGSELDGFIVIGLFGDGKRSLSYRLPERLPPDLIPGYVAEIMRREVIVCREAADEFDRRFEWVEQ